MLLQLSVHPSRDADLLTPDKINCDLNLAMRSYIDHFGNRVTRVEVPRRSSHSPIGSSFMTRANPMKRRPTWV
jgi:hypothetical protein